MMNTTFPQWLSSANKSNQASSHDIENFYDEATTDYSFWSKDYNMHFGYYRPFKTHPLQRDQMLNEMNRQIGLRLALPSDPATIADLGCGMGGTMRYLLKHNSNLSSIGVTLSDFQVAQGNRLLQGLKGIILRQNYCQTTLPSASLDGVIAIESFCHCGHSKKALAEAYRLLKSKARLVIADAFIKKVPEQMCYGSRYSYDNICKGWSLEGLGQIDHVEATLKELGFRSVQIEDISMRVAPSVLHVPFAIPSFIIKEYLKGRKIKKQSWNNLKASFYALTAGLHRKAFGYYMITAVK